jgi:hypothetical protein
MMNSKLLVAGLIVVASACGGGDGGNGPPPQGTEATLVKEIDILPNYGIHDTYVRDGIAFVCAWDEGVLIYDVGNGIKSGTPANPQFVASVAVNNAHNAWWFHNGAEKKYLFVGEEGPGSIGTSSSGDIHVIDVSDLENPVEVAFYHMSDTEGTHNFWMDENNQVLYAAYYNGGVLSLDVSGTLAGDLASRELDVLPPATGSYVWGVQLVGSSLYVTDMVHGFWQYSTTGAGDLAVAAGGNNVNERFTSDLWVHNGYAYTGTWGFRAEAGNALKVWHLGTTGDPVLVDSVITGNISTVSDVEVTADGKLLMFGAEGGSGNGFHFSSLVNPARPKFISTYEVASGIHTATFGYINGKVYAFGAKDPGSPKLVILDVTALIP